MPSRASGWCPSSGRAGVAPSVDPRDLRVERSELHLGEYAQHEAFRLDLIERGIQDDPGKVGRREHDEHHPALALSEETGQPG
ncbi:MAG TPA: hypothetical protein VFX49_06590, partial [Chloroflexota bacterium]|nr:hypothetical protein [Chloroflexota bacterium]